MDRGKPGTRLCYRSKLDLGPEMLGELQPLIPEDRKVYVSRCIGIGMLPRNCYAFVVNTTGT